LIRAHAEGCTIAVRAQPGARRTRIVGFHGEELKISVQAPSAEGRANESLINFLAAALGTARGNVQLLSGERSRSKVFLARGVKKESAEALLKSG
jgi:uncharacterized protein (TIGR00251 family)